MKVFYQFYVFLIAVILLSGCANNNVNIKLKKDFELPKAIVNDQSAILTVSLKLDIKQAEIDPVAVIENVILPANNEFQIDIINGHQKNACWNPATKDKTELTPSYDECQFVFSITGFPGVTINEDIVIKTELENFGFERSEKIFHLPINIKVVKNSSEILTKLKVSEIIIGPDFVTDIIIENTGELAINNLRIKMADWLKKIVINQSLIPVSNLDAGEEYHFIFELPGTNEVISTLKKHQPEIQNNINTGIVEFLSANTKNPIRPQLILQMQPASVNYVSFEFPIIRKTQAIIFENQSNVSLYITKINDQKLPQGTEIVQNHCIGRLISPMESCYIPVTLKAKKSKRDYKGSVVIDYKDDSNQEFSITSWVNIVSVVK